MSRKVYSIFALALASCSSQVTEQSSEPKLSGPRFTGAGGGSEQDQPLPPEGIGMGLEQKADEKLSPVPLVSIDPSVTGADRTTLQEIVDRSLGVLASASFTNHGRLIDADYPSLYLVAQNTEAASAAALRLQTEHANGGYLPVAIKIDRKASGAVVRANVGTDDLTMIINGHPIDNWRSTNSVQRSCAINTVAHEIAHTLSRSSQEWDPWFVDTDPSDSALQASRRNGTTGSYVIGSLAQCSYLNSVNRVGAQFIRSCVPTWYFYVPPANGKPESSGFANLNCDKFEENDVVQVRP